ncbi:serine hydrolase [Actinomadura chibensis]|uniref:Serine hydrolase n=1 Tax=Actinomadura chibensis TaxID=392828 RepID=A0A5D0NA87_9ACTN|nr:serine hydrolase [Actinomadura chibensis]TYB41246.1 serine hydrolase [Actinomadura chibensis]
MTRRLRIDDLTDLALPEQPVLSPDGTRLVYVLRTDDTAADRCVRRLWTVDTAGGRPRRLTRGAADVSPAWSPDGSQVAFLRGEDGPPQVWLLPADGGEPERVTDLPLGAGPPCWKPDGTALAFTAPFDLDASPGEDDAARARRRAAPIVTDRIDHRADGAGLIGRVRAQVFVLELGSRQVRRVTSGDWQAGDPAWSPDGTRLAFGATLPDTDLTGHSAAYVLDVSDRKAAPRRIGPAEGSAGPVVWTSGGDALLVVGTYGTVLGHNRLLRVPLDGGPATDLSGMLDRNVMPGAPGYPGSVPRLVEDGEKVLFCARDQGCTHLYVTSTAGGGTPRRVVGGPGWVVSGVDARNGTAAIVLATEESFGEIVTVDLATGVDTVRTAHGAPFADAEIYRREERMFPISDGAVVQGWVMRDPDADAPGPLLLDIHGGPHNAWNAAADHAHLYHQELVARGWTVLLLNPRGSDGYGEAFLTAALGGWGVADAADFLEPLDVLVAEGVADPSRLAVSGYSYGGYMTCYLTSRTGRFAAAVAGGVVADLVSLAGTSDCGNHLAEYELGGQPWSGRDRYAEMSPYSRVEDVTAPTLLLHGTADLRCPDGQAEQWIGALRARGVPSRLVYYPDASHFFFLDGPPSHRADFNRRIVDWVERYAGGTGRAPIDAAHWQRRLGELADRHRVPGAVLGILRVVPGCEDELVEAAHGVLNTATGVAATPDSLFQIGSMTKVWTATLVMQLVDEGLLDLDAPVVDVLPELRLSDPDGTKRVTMRHLLTHTSGIDGDVFTDTGRGDDCVEKYTAELAEVARNHPLGATWSYCNAGFTLAGRVVEKLTGRTWDRALRERIIEPLGLEHTVTLPEEALLHRAAVGHVVDGDAEPVRAGTWALPRSLGPAGLITASAADALGFARLHLTGGLAPDGTRLLSERSVAEMAAEHAVLPDRYGPGDSWGLGWARMGWDGRRLVGHDGNTIGQSAYLRVLPDEGLAVVLLTNGGQNVDLYEDLFREIFAELAGVAMPRPVEPAAPPPPVDVRRHTGRYRRTGADLEVFERAGRAVLRMTATGPLAEIVAEPVTEYDLHPVDAGGNLFAVREPAERTWQPVAFYALPTGERYLHFGVRATPKCD